MEWYPFPNNHSSGYFLSNLNYLRTATNLQRSCDVLPHTDRHAPKHVVTVSHANDGIGENRTSWMTAALRLAIDGIPGYPLS
jgi:hypothetical protein